MTNFSLRGFVGGNGRADDHRGYGGLRGLLVPWDMSKASGSNDRVEKLGSGDAAQAIAFSEFNETSKLSQPADGYTMTVPTEVTSYASLDPDNWVLRLHEAKGDGKDNAWALRMQTDHKNSSETRKHRSTIWVDQCDPQNWAFSQDLMWIIKLGASVKDAEIKFDGAGFLPQIKTKDAEGAAERACAALNISKQGGYVTDGIKIAQLWHIMGFPSGGTTAGGACGEAEQDNLVLRGDVEFDFGGDLAHIALEPTPVMVGIRRWRGAFYIDEPGAAPGGEVGTDASSNQTEIPRTLHRGLRPWIESMPVLIETGGYTIPPPTLTPPPGGPPGFPPIPIPPRQNIDTYITLVSGGYVIDALEFVAEGGTHPIMEGLSDGLSLEYYFGLATDATPGHALQTIEYSFMYVVTGPCDAGPPPTPTELTLSIPSLDLKSTSFCMYSFTIPAAELLGKAGGTVAFGLTQKASSTFIGNTIRTAINARY